MDITKIVLTGGPSGGKSSAQSRIMEVMSDMGYKVLFIPETATLLDTAGAGFRHCGSVVEFEKKVLKMQMDMEATIEALAKTMDAEKILIVCDRGTLDVKAYIGEELFSQVLKEMNCSEISLRDRYDGVFHLVTPAKDAPQFYTLENNPARRETPGQACEIDDKLLQAWTGHPHLRVIDNSTDFEGKKNRLLAEIASLLGEPEPMEIERKFLIGYPDMEWLTSLPNCQKVEIIQTYLWTGTEDEMRVRQRGLDGDYVYFLTVKKKISDLKRIEIEKRISQKEYLRFLMSADTSRRPIRKDRYCLAYDGQYLEIDIYPFWKDQAILEIEMRDEDIPIHIPEQIRVIREVTYEEEFKNASLAKMQVTV